MYIFYFLSTAPSVRIWADTPVPYAGADKSIRAAQQGAFAASIYLPCVFGSSDERRSDSDDGHRNLRKMQ